MLSPGPRANLCSGLAGALLSLGLAGPACSPPAPRPEPAARPGVDGKRALALLERIVALGPRTPGSQASARMRALLKQELEGLGVQVEQQMFRAELRGQATAMVNLWARIPGRRADHVIVLGSHYDTKITSGHPDPAHNFPFQSANDGGSSSALLVELARHLAARENLSTLWLAWFDGEESVPFHWDDDQALFGSRHFVATLRERGELSTVKAMVLLDIVGYPNLRLDDEALSTPRLKGILAQAAARMGARGVFFQPPRQEIKDDHYPFLQAGIPAVNLIGLTQFTEAGIWHTPKDTVDRVSADSLSLVGDVVLLALPELEAL